MTRLLTSSIKQVHTFSILYSLQKPPVDLRFILMLNFNYIVMYLFLVLCVQYFVTACL